MWGSSARMRSDFTFVQSCDLDANIQIKICTMEGSLPQLELKELLQWYFVSLFFPFPPEGKIVLV